MQHPLTKKIIVCVKRKKRIGIKLCLKCGGEGTWKKINLVPCKICSSKGWTIKNEGPVLCSSCGGNGKYRDLVAVTCENCKGGGQLFCVLSVAVKKCDSCKGLRFMKRLETCVNCKGSGYIPASRQSFAYEEVDKCPNCLGFDVKGEEECSTCRGSGEVENCTLCVAGLIVIKKECNDCKGHGITLDESDTKNVTDWSC